MRALLLAIALFMTGMLFLFLVMFVLVQAIGQIGDGLGMWEWQ